jgi:hypothetical protein
MKIKSSVSDPTSFIHLKGRGWVKRGSCLSCAVMCAAYYQHQQALQWPEPPSNQYTHHHHHHHPAWPEPHHYGKFYYEAGSDYGNCNSPGVSLAAEAKSSPVPLTSTSLGKSTVILMSCSLLGRNAFPYPYRSSLTPLWPFSSTSTIITCENTNLKRKCVIKVYLYFCL